LNGQAGFAAVDALVALVILSTTLAMGLVATDSARKVAASAAAIRRAEALARDLLADSPYRVGISSGRSAGLDWRLEVTPLSPVSTAERSRLCQASAAIRAGARGRTFTLTTVDACRPETTS